MGEPKWINQGDAAYMPSWDTTTISELPPGVYDISVGPIGVFFEPVRARADELLSFPGTIIGDVVEEIETFWKREGLFRSHDIPYKRGILLYGPPGSGKSCTLQLISRDVVTRGGVVLLFTHPDSFAAAYRVFRQVQPETPMVVLMEDLDVILNQKNETKVLNLLDGIETVDKVVFLATTNYPERLEDRVANRPSRFDRKYKVPYPNEGSRHLYLDALLRDGDDVDIARWIKDTEGLSLAHLKELFVGVAILGGDYNAILKKLKEMHERVSSAGDGDEFGRETFGHL